MKYYAVTEDPRELYHYGVKGMKWGQHLFGDKPKSLAYKRATKKLKANSRAKEERKYENAVKKSQDKIARVENLYKADQKGNRKPTAREKNALVERLHKMDQDKAIYKAINKEQKRAAKQQKLAEKAYRAEEKREMKYAKNEAKMDKYVQQARQGKLKYGKLSPDQIQRVQDRLLLEANTRKLGSAEKTWGQQKREARKKGKLLGIEKGTAAAMEEVAKAGVQYGIRGLLNRRKLDAKAKYEGRREHLKDIEKNRKSHRELKGEVKDKIYKERYEADRRINSEEGKELTRLTEQKKLEDKKNEQVRNMLISSGYNSLDAAIADQKRLLKETNKDKKDREAYRAFAYATPEEQRDMLLASYNKHEKAKEQLEKDKKEQEAREKEQKEADRKRIESEAKGRKIVLTGQALEKYRNGEDLSYTDLMLLKEAGLIKFNNQYTVNKKKKDKEEK